MSKPDIDSEDTAVIRMVARREINSRVKTKSFILITVISLIVLMSLSGVARLTATKHTTLSVGLLADNTSLDAPLQSASKETNISLKTVVVASEAEGRARVEDDSISALVIGNNPTLTAIVKEHINDNLNLLLSIALRQTALTNEINNLGGNAVAIRTKVNATEVKVSPLHPPKTFNKDRLELGFITGMLIYIALVAAGQTIAQGVVEEKTSRVVEILLASIKPWQLMTGKILGIGAVSLLQIAILAAGGCISAIALGSIPLPSSTIIGAAVWLAVWFLLGFTMYAVAFAALGALVSRQEDIGSVVTPLMALLIGGYAIGATVLPGHPDNSVVATLSLLPVFSPMLMPIRLAMGNVPNWQIVLSIALVIAVIPLLTWLSSRIYRNSVMQSGARIRLRDALRGA